MSEWLKSALKFADHVLPAVLAELGGDHVADAFEILSALYTRYNGDQVEARRNIPDMRSVIAKKRAARDKQLAGKKKATKARGDE